MNPPKPIRTYIRPSQLINPAPAQATLTATAVGWIATALRLELPDEISEEEIQERAEVLHAISINWDVPIEVLVAWIHAPAPDKEWTGGEWRRWCTKYREQLRQINAQLAAAEYVYPERTDGSQSVTTPDHGS